MAARGRKRQSEKYLNYVLWLLIAGVVIFTGLIIYTVFFTKPVPRSPEEQEYFLAKELVQKNPNNSYYLQRLAEAEYDLGKYRDAIKHYDKAIKLAPYRPMLHYGKGLCYLRLGDKKNAFKEFQEELKVTNDMNELAWLEIGRLYREYKKYEDAIKSFEWVLKRAPTLTDAHYELAEVYYDMGKYDMARKYILEVLRYDPTNEDAKKFLADVEVKLKATSQDKSETTETTANK